MSKITKQAEVLAAIQAQVKAAAEKQSTEIVKATSTPVPAVEQNSVKPEELSPKQTPEQKKAPVEVIHKKSEDETKEAPVADKAAEVKPEEKKADAAPEVKSEVNTDLQKAATEILAMVSKMAAAEKQSTEIVKAVSTPAAPVEQNAVKPEELSPKQAPVQKPAAKKADEETIDADKVASYEFGKLLAEMSIKQAAEQELSLYKQAGRRDFEQLVNMAAQAMEQNKQAVTKQAEEVAPAMTEKQAEEAGRETFRNLYKQAEVEYSVNQAIEENKQLKEKLASIESAKTAELESFKKQAAEAQAKYDAMIAEQKEAEKFARFAEVITSNVTNNVMSQIKNELLKGH